MGGRPGDDSPQASLLVPKRRPSWVVPLYVDDPRAVIRRRGGRLLVSVDGEVVTTVAILRLSEVVLLGDVDLSTSALDAMLRAGVPVVFLDHTGRARGRLEPIGSAHVPLRQQQLVASSSPERCLEISKAFVAAKIHNQRVLVARRLRAPGRRDDHLDLLTRAVRHLERREHAATEADSIETLRGIEGAAAHHYYGALRAVLPTELGFGRRDPAAHDVFNALTNYCSALLRETVIGSIAAAGLDPGMSFLHVPSRGRPTLAFDLMEEWRPVLLDATVLALLGLGAVRWEHMVTDAVLGVPRLDRDARAATIRRYRERLASVAPSRDRLRSRGPSSTPASDSRAGTYEDRVRQQVRALRAWIRGDRDAYAPFRWR